MSSLLEFLVGALVGAVIGVFLERVLGRPVDHLLTVIQDRRRHRAGVRMTSEYATNTRLFPIAGEFVYLHQFSPAGYELNSRFVAQPADMGR